MGTGASCQDAAAAIRSASPEELRAALQELPDGHRSKLVSAVEGAPQRGLVLCLGAEAPPKPMPLPAPFDLVASGMYSTVARCADGTLWRLHDGMENEGCEQIPHVPEAIVRSLHHLSVHDCTVVGLTSDDKCYAFVGNPEITAAFVTDKTPDEVEDVCPLELDTLSGHRLVEIVGHSPEDWLLGRTADSAILAFGPRIGKVRRIDLDGICKQVSMSLSTFGLALLEGGGVYMIGGSKAQYHAGPEVRDDDSEDETSAEQTSRETEVTHVKELDDKDIICVAAGGQHCVAVTSGGSVFTWGTSHLYESQPVLNGKEISYSYFGALYRQADNFEEEDPTFEVGGTPELARLPPGFEGASISRAISGPTGDVTLLLSDNRVVRAALGSDLRVEAQIWGASSSIDVLPHRYTVMVSAIIPVASLQAAIEAHKQYSLRAEAKAQAASATGGDEEEEEDE